jgi:hypothetical protein
MARSQLPRPAGAAAVPPSETDRAALELARVLARMLARQHDAAERKAAGRED